MELEDWKRTLLSLRDQVETQTESGCPQAELVEKLNRLLSEAKKHLGTKLQEIKASADSTGSPGQIKLVNQVSELIEYMEHIDCNAT